MTVGLAKSWNLICGNSHPELGRRLAESLGVPLLPAEITRFADGETRVYLASDVIDSTACILQSTCTPVSENLLTLALLVDAAKAAGARRVIGLVPYFGFARQEQRSRNGESRSAQVAAKLLGTVGLDHLVVVDLHAPALESAFPFATTMLQPDALFLERIRSWQLQNPIIISPDAGGMKRAQRFATTLEWPLAAVTKSRPAADVAKQLSVLGEVRGRSCVIVDDMASTGSTLAGAAEALSKSGAVAIHAVYTHAVMAPGAMDRLLASPINRLLTSDSVPVVPHERLKIVTVAAMLASTMRQLCTL